MDESNRIDFDNVITVCFNGHKHRPYYPTHVIKLHHNFPDPAKAEGAPEEVMGAFRSARAMIKDQCLEFTASNV